MKNYCIREDYEPLTVAATFVEDISEYWTETRIAQNGFFQYYVYKAAARALMRMKNRAFADVGCGYGAKTEELIVPITTDITMIDQPSMEPMLTKRLPNCKFLPLNLEGGDLELDRKFDCIVCADVIEHLLDPDSLLDFIRKSLAPHGIAFVSTPERDIQRGPNCLKSPKLEHVREWTAREFAAYIGSSGFEILTHRLLPKGRLTWSQSLAAPFLRHRRAIRYCGCQMVVCKRL